MKRLVDQFGAPIGTGGTSSGFSRDAGAYRGTIANWHPLRTTSRDAEVRERELTQHRAADLAANDWAAKSGIRTISDNAVGTGLVPKSSIPNTLLSISREDARAIGEKFEWIFSLWSQQSHSRGICQFEDLQYLGIYSVLRAGEMLHVPVMLPLQHDRMFSFALQDLHPSRLCTPADKKLDTAIKDGIEMTESGIPVAYWLACPKPALFPMVQQGLFSSDFQRRPAYLGHRQNIFHLYRYDEEEQVRGVSALANGMKLFRNLNDALDSELFAQVIASSFPVFIGLEEGATALPPEVREQYGFAGYDEPMERMMDVSPGTVLFGKPNEKPYVLENKRQSANFPPFIQIILRSMAAMLGTPYESLSKDYSNTNYSSMRAALNEAWKLYMFYRHWFSRQYTQPVYELVIEEAYLRNIMGIADDIDALGTQGFYEARKLWCSATWVGPARGAIDPVKEVQATILALKNRLTTYGEAWAERGGDWDDALPVMEEESLALSKLAKLSPPTSPSGNNQPGQNQPTQVPAKEKIHAA